MSENKSNTFAQLEAAQTSSNDSKPTTPAPVSREMSFDNFSDKAVGDQVKYTRPNLDGQEDVVSMFQIFEPDTNDRSQEVFKASKDGQSHYWKVQAVLTYESKNEDGLNNREYISGARAFEQKNKTASPISFWYPDAQKQSQMAYLWELVAQKKGIKPEELSPREFVVFLNSKPKVKLVAKEYDNFGAKKGEPAKIKKNMIAEFL